MKISIIIPFKNDWDLLPKVLEHLLNSSETECDNFEIIVVNDGSTHGNGKFRPIDGIDHPTVRVINISQSFGVGACFDRGVENAQSENIILMGSDVFPHEGWHDKVLNAINSRPNSIGCAVCVGDKPPHKKFYGADMLFTMGNDDLPPESKLRERKGGYTSLFKGKWAEKKSNEPYDISCLMGAFYFTTKRWYQTIGGFDTEYKNKYCGHRQYGHLEPYLSLKSWLCGGGCYLVPTIEATHIFNRVDPSHRGEKGVRSAEWTWWNAVFMLETMILLDSVKNKMYDFVNPELNFNNARKMIKDNYSQVEKVRERNRERFKLSLGDYITKFNIKIR